MSPLNIFAGQRAAPNGQPAARPAAQPDASQPNWTQPQWTQPQQPAAAPQPAAYGYQQPGYPQQTQYGLQGDYHHGQAAPYPAQPAVDPYAAQYDPYGAAAAQNRAHQQPAFQQPAPAYQPYQPQQQAAWPQHEADPRGFDPNAYHPAQAAPQHANAYRGAAEHEHLQNDWGQGAHMHADAGFAQAAGGELDPSYGEEEAEYEVEEEPRGRRSLMIAAALAGAIFVGGGLAYGYKAFLGGGSAGDPPLVKSASAPSKIKPADAGGKQFSHADSKILGRLGEGTAVGAGVATPAAAGDVDPTTGARKVATLVVGRDGSIQAPPAAEAVPSAAVTVPGLTVVDAFGGNREAAAAPAPAEPAPPVAPQQVVAAPQPPQKPVTIAKAEPDPTPSATGSIEDAPVAPPAAKKPPAKKVAAATPATATDATAAPASSVATSGSGFVAVLASVPRSESSRLEALKRFADLQQKYSTTLSGRTPDVAEANLGAKGNYHRLVVGPPGSREQASSLCTQLKSQGYPDCWVTSY